MLEHLDRNKIFFWSSSAESRHWFSCFRFVISSHSVRMMARLPVLPTQL